MERFLALCSVLSRIARYFLPENHCLVMLRQDKLLVHEVVIVLRESYFRYI